MTPSEAEYLKLVNDVLNLDEPVGMDTSAADAGADSLDLVELVMAVEEMFDLSVEVNELANIETPRQLYNLFMHHRAEGITGRDLLRHLAELSIGLRLNHLALQCCRSTVEKVPVLA
jgi:acyl carrier protein